MVPPFIVADFVTYDIFIYLFTLIYIHKVALFNRGIMLNVKGCSVFSEVKHSNNAKPAHLSVHILRVDKHLGYGISVVTLRLINVDSVVGYVTAENKLYVSVL